MSAGGLRGRRILVVEDEMLVAMLIEDVLTEAGCKLVGPATGVAQALGLIRDAPVEAAVLDVNVNGGDTYPIADALAQRGIPFVFATGYGAAGIRRDHADRPVLRKPFGEGELTTALLGLLGRADP